MNRATPTNDTWPPDGLETLDACPVCGATEAEVAHDKCRDVVFGAAEGEWTVHRCADCGSGFLNPRPTPDTIGRAYSTYYTHETRLKSPAVRRSLKHAALDRVRGSYINAHYGRGQPSLGRVGLVLADRLPELKRSLDNSHRFVAFPHGVKTPRLLDLGCGNGDFLKIVSRVGWETYGSDPDPSALEITAAGESDIRQGGIEVWRDWDGMFDAITMNHVIEHLHDPVGTLRRCFDLLKPGGRLYVETPNFDSCGHAIYGSYWRGLEVPRHLVIFTWNSLARALEDAGFAIERRVVRDNFVKQSVRSAKCESGIFDHQAAGDAELRLPTKRQIEDSRNAPEKSEWIGLLAHRGE